MGASEISSSELIQHPPVVLGCHWPLPLFLLLALPQISSVATPGLNPHAKAAVLTMAGSSLSFAVLQLFVSAGGSRSVATPPPPPAAAEAPAAADSISQVGSPSSSSRRRSAQARLWPRRDSIRVLRAASMSPTSSSRPRAGSVSARDGNVDRNAHPPGDACCTVSPRAQGPIQHRRRRPTMSTRSRSVSPDVVPWRRSVGRRPTLLRVVSDVRSLMYSQ